MYRIVALICLAVLPSIALGEEASYPKLSPFSAIRWEDDHPQVQVGKTWYALVKIDDVTTTEIVEFCDSKYQQLSRQRFAEDLVEVQVGYEIRLITSAH